MWGFINDIDPTDFADTDDDLRWYRLVADYNGIGDALWVAHSAEWAVLHFADRDGGCSCGGNRTSQVRASSREG